MKSPRYEFGLDPHIRRHFHGRLWASRCLRVTEVCRRAAAGFEIGQEPASGYPVQRLVRAD